SLQPHVERLAFSILMDVDAAGHVVRYALHKTLIRSCARLVYEQVNAALAGDPAQAEHHAALLPVLRQMEEISRKLRARRHARGSIDFDLEESAITLDAQGEPASVAPRLRGIAECMIEDFMLTANETVAAYARAMEIPFLYRVHEEPDGDRLEEFSTFLSNLGLRIRGARNGVQPQMLQQVLTQAADRPEAPVVSKLMLRAMKKARYAPQPLGHFGLAAQDYCHFTSPIRRYPDLCIHRILSMVISGKMDEKQQERLQKRVQETAEETSRSERNAMDAERAADSLMKARYMRQFIGEEYTGVISGVQAWGFYVALPSTVEGLVHVRTLSDYFTYDAAQYCLVGARSRRIFRIGDPVRVRVEGVDLAERLVQFTYLSSKV
ncbi:MAG: RNB domain-containing ribonuclease, partial [Clostridia bacterium]